jgi:hypothetical protein
MAVRATMSALISRVRSLVNDTAGPSQIFSDQEIQDVLDFGRLDVKNQPLVPKPTFSGSTIQYLDYYAAVSDWEDDVVFKQYLTVTVTPSVSEPIAGHWQFSTTTLPPIYLSGKTYDIYRSSADLLDRWATKWALSYDFSSDGQSFRRSQAAQSLRDQAKAYRMQQRPRSISLVRSDLASDGRGNGLSLDPTAIDYMASGDGR